jgi:hypothetical protein
MLLYYSFIHSFISLQKRKQKKSKKIRNNNYKTLFIISSIINIVIKSYLKKDSSLPSLPCLSNKKKFLFFFLFLCIIFIPEILHPAFVEISFKDIIKV